MARAKRTHGNRCSKENLGLGYQQLELRRMLAPVADAGGPYLVESGSVVQLDGSASTEPFNDIQSYEWDFDYDGVNFDVDASGVTTPYVASATGTLTAALRVADGAGQTGIQEFEIFVRGRQPVFNTTQSISVGNTPLYATTGDLNGDSLPDLVVGTNAGSFVNIYYSDGSGGVNPSPMQLSTGTSPLDFVVVDVDNDGDNDIVHPISYGNGLGVHRNLGGGTFAAMDFYSTGLYAIGVDVGDLNGDGFVDVAVANYDSGSVSILVNSGSGGFTETNEFGGGSTPHAVEFGDLNQDGNLDLVVAVRNSNQIRVFEGDGAANFSAAGVYSTGVEPYKVKIADLDNDGDLDVITADRAGDQVSVFMGVGDGTLMNRAAYPASGNVDGPAELAIADINADGFLDILTTEHYNHLGSILYGNGDGTFELASNKLSTGVYPRGIVATDLDLNGSQEIITIAETGTIKVWTQERIQADAGGPYVVSAGQAVQLDASGSTDPYNNIASYEWDFNHDGVNFDVDETGVSPTFNATSLSIAENRNIAVRVTDATGFSSVSTAELAVLGLVSQWSFNGTESVAQDEIGNNDGVINGTTRQTGLIDGSLSFNGSSDSIEVANSADLTVFDQLTLEAWVKFDTTGNTYDTFLWKEDSAATFGRDFGLTRNRLGDLSKSWMGKLNFIIETDSEQYELTSPELPTANRWYHIVGTYNGAEQRIYVDGELKNSRPLTGSVLPGTGPLYLGTNGNPTSPHFFGGDLDQIAIFNRAISETEVQNRYQQHVPSVDQPDVWYTGEGSFDDIVGINDGLIQGDVRFVPGMVGRALEFDGNDAVNVLKRDGRFNPGASDFSIEAWVNLDTVSDGEILKNYAGLERYGLSVVGGAVTLVARDGSGNQALVIGDTTMDPGQWYHVAGVRSGNTFSVYLDGQLDGTQNVSVGSINPATNYVRIGASRTDGGAISNSSSNENFFSGRIDELSYWRRALSVTELSDIYTLGLNEQGKPAPAPTAWFKGDGNSLDSVSLTSGIEQGNIQYELGINGEAFSFGGNDAFSVFQSDERFSPGVGDFSIEASIQLDDYAAETIFKNYGGVQRFNLTTVNGRLNLTARDSSGTQVSITGNTVLDLNQWYDVVGVRHGNRFSVYVDGNLDSTMEMAIGSVIPPTSYLRIGASRTDGGAANNPTSNEAFFTGKIDDLKYHNRAIIPILNFPPVAVDDSFQGPEDLDIVGDLSTNDSDDDGDTLTYSLGTGPVNGSVTVNADGTFTYTPALNFNGSDSFTYTVSDGAESATATVSLTIAPVNDGPIAVDDEFVLDEDGVLNSSVSGNDSDEDGDSLDFGLATGPANGSVVVNADGTFTYTPNHNFNGSDSFTYSVTDGTELATATVSITVNAVNDSPVAVGDVVETDEDHFVTGNVSSNDLDVDGDALTFALSTGPVNGSVDFNSDGTFTYTPNADFNGSDSFTYSVSDGAQSATATVNITVNAVNDGPVAVDDVVVTNEDAFVAGDVSVNDSDVDGDALTFALGTGPVDGSIVFNPDGTFTYTPNVDFNGSDSFTYSVSDGNESATAVVNITVNAVNDGPIAIDDNVTIDEDSPVNISVLSNDSDADGDTLAVNLLVPASNGTVTANGDGTFSYQPDLNFFGTDSFVYTIEDPQGEVATAVVTISVTSVNDSPVAVDDSGFVNAGQLLTLDLSGNDADVEDGLDLASIQIISGPSSGSIQVNGDGTVTYTNLDTSVATDSFVYQISDVDGGISNSATALITIESGSDPGSQVELDNGTLRVRTTDLDDDVVAQIVNGQLTIQITNSLGNASYDFDTNLVDAVDVRLRDGDDTADFGNVSIPVSVRAGAGNDTVTGGGGSDDLRGGAGDDILNGGGGDDDIRGGKGADIIEGGSGNDTISGNSGNDTISGGDGNDNIRGQSGDDFISGGAGFDQLDGGGGDDELRGGTGLDVLIGGNGNDVLLGESGSDMLLAGNGADILVGGDGFDWLDAGSGRDILIGGRDSDLLQGRGGDDILIAGYTAFDNDVNALNQIRAEWTSSRSYGERVVNLSGQGSGPSENGNVHLVFGGNDATVFDDGSVDLVFGQSGMDWFFVDQEDIDDQRLSEILANDLGGLL